MKIALCLFKYFPYGGMQRDFLRIAKMLAKNHWIEVFTTDWQGEIPEGIHVHMMKVSQWTNHRRMQSFAKKVIKQAKISGCALIVGFNKIPGVDIYFAADNCYVKQVQESHGFFYRLMPRYWVYKALEKGVFSRRNTRVLFLAESQKQQYQKMYSLSEEQCCVLPVEFGQHNVSAEEKTGIRQLHGIRSNEYLVLMVCSAFKTKGVDRALQALSRLSSELLQKTHLLVIGQNNAVPFLRLTERLGIESRVQFLGESKNVLDYMCAADLFLHPARREAAGKVLIEAMSCGVPILTTFECGYAEHVMKADAGVVVPNKYLTDEILANTITNMLTATEETKAQWREKALAYAANYPSENLAQAAANIIENYNKGP